MIFFYMSTTPCYNQSYVHRRKDYIDTWYSVKRSNLDESTTWDKTSIKFKLQITRFVRLYLIKCPKKKSHEKLQKKKVDVIFILTN